MPYPPALVAPMRAEMTRMGARELTTASEVERSVSSSGVPALRTASARSRASAGTSPPSPAGWRRWPLRLDRRST